MYLVVIDCHKISKMALKVTRNMNIQAGPARQVGIKSPSRSQRVSDALFCPNERKELFEVVLHVNITYL